MDVSSVTSPLVATGTTQGAPSYIGAVSPAANTSSQPNNSRQTTVSVPQTTPNVQTPTSTQVAKAVKQMNDSFNQRSQNMYATIGVDKASGVEVVKIVDRDTNETIVQYPSKAALAAADAIQRPKGTGGQLINANA